MKFIFGCYKILNVLSNSKLQLWSSLSDVSVARGASNYCLQNFIFYSTGYFLNLHCEERSLMLLSILFVNQRLVPEEYSLSSSAKPKGHD